MNHDEQSKGAGCGGVQAAVVVARGCGIPVETPTILHRGSSLIVRLAAGGPVARVGGVTAITRDLETHYAREVDIAAWLVHAGAPVVGPWDPPGPFRHDGRVVTLWEEVRAAEPAPGELAGRALRTCHEALRGYRAGLPSFTCLLDEAALILESIDLASADRALLARALEHVRTGTASLRLPEQALHGDAGMGNVLTGGIWNDWEDCCVGPVVWDLACLVASSRILDVNRERAEAALVAYGDVSGLRDLDTFVRARAVQVMCWSLLTSARTGCRRERTERRMAWLRAQDWAR